MSGTTYTGGGPTLRIGGASYPVLLPRIRDPRLHLAGVIVSLQVLGQVAFEFRLSIAQILVAIGTAAAIELAVLFRRQRAIVWPASAMLTGNGVAFVLRVPGTEHGDWWSMHGWWIFAGTAALGILSKYLIRFRGRHIFNPSNIALVAVFLAIGPERADPLDLWWGPMSWWMALALAIIVAGGFAILRRLHLTGIAIGFWLAFAAGMGVLALSGHEMYARWHLGPVTGFEFWRVLVFSPEILVFLFFMITDPRTIPDSPNGRRAYAVGIGLLATLLIAPQTTEFATKVAVLGALAIACAARPVALFVAARLPARASRAARPARRGALGTAALLGCAAFAGLVVLAGAPARSGAETALAPIDGAAAPPKVTVAPSPSVATELDEATAEKIAGDAVGSLQIGGEALRSRNREQATAGAAGAWLAGLWQQIGDAQGKPIVVPRYDIERARVGLEPGHGQGPPIAVVALQGRVALETYTGSPPKLTVRSEPVHFDETFELGLEDGRYRILASRTRPATPAAPAPTTSAAGAGIAGVQLEDVAADVGLDFRHGAFRFGTSHDETSMMGGGVCWLDYDADGWLDLFVVNSYTEEDISTWQERGGLPRAALFRNVQGRFEDVSRKAGADLPLRGNGCVAADFDQDGHTDLYVTTSGYNVATNGYDALLWNRGDGTFAEGARAAGINTPGWHAGAAVGDVNGDGRPDLFVAGYTDVNRPIAGSEDGFPSNHEAVADHLYLNQGPGENGRVTFREVGRAAGLERASVDHGLGAVFTDVDGDGRLDLYVANDEDPNRLYLNTPADGGIGFRFEEAGQREGVADPNASMGIASGDYDVDGRADLFVTNARGQLHAAYRTAGRDDGFEDARPEFAQVLGARFTGWGTSWVDLDLDGDLDLTLANGGIPVLDLRKDAQTMRVLAQGGGAFADATDVVGLGQSPRLNGRGLAAADYDNDGDVDFAVGSIAGRFVLLRNTGATGHWLEVSLDRFAPGTQVTATLPDGRRLVREVLAGSSYLSSEDPRVHFGLGEAERVRQLVVRWPDGRETRLHDVEADQLVAAAHP